MPNLTNYQRELVEAANRLSIHLPGEARIPILVAVLTLADVAVLTLADVLS